MKFNDTMAVRILLDSDEGKTLRERYCLDAAATEVVRLYGIGDVRAKTEDEDGEAPVIVSTNDVDRMGDIVDPKGVDLKAYRKNPVILWAHRYDVPPIGKALYIKKVENGLIAKPQWASSEFAQQIKQLYDEKIMRAWSIGFVVKEWESIDKEADPNGYRGRIYKKTELLEFSAVPVPANPNALSLAMKGVRDGKVSEDVLSEIVGFFKSEPLRTLVSMSIGAAPETIKAVETNVAGTGTDTIRIVEAVDNPGEADDADLEDDDDPSVSQAAADAEEARAAEEPAAEPVTDAELAQVKADLEQVRRDLADLRDGLAEIRGIISKITKQEKETNPDEPVLRVDGATLHVRDVVAAVGAAVDGRMKAITGIVS